VEEEVMKVDEEAVKSQIETEEERCTSKAVKENG